MKKLKKDSRIFSYDLKGKKKYGVEFYRSVHGTKVPLRKRGFDDSYAAIEWANESERNLQLQSGTARRVTVEEYYHAWMDRNESYWSVETYHDYHMKFKNYLLPEFGKYELREVTREQFQKFITRMENVPRSSGRIGYSSKTISTLRNYMSMLLNDAVYSGIIPNNKLRNLKIKQHIGEKNNEIDVKTYDRAIRTAERILNPGYLAAFYLSLVALRHGEILGMQPRNIFEDHVSVSIARTAHQPKGGGTKTPAGVRDVPIMPKIYQLLQSAVKYARQLYLDNEKPFTGKDFIFVNEDATAWSYTRLNYIFDMINLAMGNRIAVYGSGSIYVDDSDGHRVIIDQDHNIRFDTTNGFTPGQLSQVKLTRNVMDEVTGVEVSNEDGSKVVVTTQVDTVKARATLLDNHGHEVSKAVIGEKANVAILNNPHIFPHKMRHAFATFSVPIADDPVDVMKIMGHTDLRMTRYYDNGTKEGQQKIVNLMDRLA
ncbi:tyrosine-type recombinase/integrase [Levilactobacillus wangkuiensis]|uniref:tyrosine-type recombinase/integrase n=1 Tax=Levilactobacillus wangkuiensis TaxID=2799566 RepID=UPI0019446B26|nr:tyrosine-type recombinase/integrase [Levilactobacillus wangkuiensis]